MGDSRRIISKSDGEELIGHVSYCKMAESSPHTKDLELFDYMYSFLSEYTHPSFASVELVVREEGKLDPLSNELQSEAMFYSICFAAMILGHLQNLSLLSPEAKVNIQTVVNRIYAKAVALMDALFEVKPLGGPFAVLRARLVPTGHPY